MSKNDIIFNVQDYRGKNVEFTKNKWKEKKDDHPELNKNTFINCIKRALIDPDEVWQDYSSKKKRCYYKKYSTISYAKVVIWNDEILCRVVTAYEIDKIKEKNYPKLKQYR